MSKIPSMSSKKLCKLLEKGGVNEGKRYSAPVQVGKKTLDSIYCKRVLRQLKFTDEEISKIRSVKL